jgi:hypothetical protein
MRNPWNEIFYFYGDFIVLDHILHFEWQTVSLRLKRKYSFSHFRESFFFVFAKTSKKIDKNSKNLRESFREKANPVIFTAYFTMSTFCVTFNKIMFKNAYFSTHYSILCPIPQTVHITCRDTSFKMTRLSNVVLSLRIIIPSAIIYHARIPISYCVNIVGGLITRTYRPQERIKA